MIPIHALFSRIRWDRQYAAAEFEVGYYDRVAGRILRVPFRQLRFEPADRFSFQLVDAEGESRSIPYHRVRAVYRNGVVIWQR